MAEDDIRLVSDEYKSSSLKYELPSTIYTYKYLSEVLSRNVQSEFEGANNTVVTEHDDISMKTNLVVRPAIIAERFDEKSFFSNFLGFNSYWHCKIYNEYISQRFIKLSTTKKSIKLRCY